MIYIWSHIWNYSGGGGDGGVGGGKKVVSQAKTGAGAELGNTFRACLLESIWPKTKNKAMQMTWDFLLPLTDFWNKANYIFGKKQIILARPYQNFNKDKI